MPFASLPLYEGATRANDRNERSEIEGEAPQAYACGGGDASPINCIAANSCLVEIEKWRRS